MQRSDHCIKRSTNTHPGCLEGYHPGVNLNELYGCNDVQFDPSNPSVLYACFDEKTSQPPPALNMLASYEKSQGLSGRMIGSLAMNLGRVASGSHQISINDRMIKTAQLCILRCTTNKRTIAVPLLKAE